MVVIGDDLHAVRDKPFDIVACDCNECNDGGCANATTHHASSITPVLVPLGRGTEVSIVEPFVSDGCGGNDTGVFDRSFILHGLIGPLLMVSVHDMDQRCYFPHPVWTTQSMVFDLERGTRLPTDPPDGLMGALLARAREQLCEDCVLNPDENPRFFAGLPKLKPAGAIATDYIFLMSASYMCGTGPDHYSVGTAVEVPGLPPAIEGRLDSSSVSWASVPSDAIGISAVLSADAAPRARDAFLHTPIPPGP